jgi:N-acetylmuramoyl-L-alanine amidase
MRIKILAVALAALCLAFAIPPAVRAEEAGDAVLTAFDQGVTNGRFEATLTFRGTPRSRLIILRNPDRVALDLFDTVSAAPIPATADGAAVAEMRQGLVSPDRFRIVWTLKRLALPVAETRTEGDDTILSLRLERTDVANFARAAASQTIGIQTAEAPRAIAPAAPGVFTIVLDPGHGGVDTGAKGPAGTLEKEVNLAFALSLRDALAKDTHVRVLLTREDDRFIPLIERSEIARRAKADLFISMHADSIRYRDIRGATVYTLSEKASDSLSLEIADSENSADRFAGPEWRQGKPEVFDILVDLTRRETDSFSEHFAAGLVDAFSEHKIRRIKHPQRSAGFRVLMAPDVPSVLVEIGYLSNADDEKLLLESKWRDDTTAAISRAILAFLSTRTPGATGP